MIRVLLDPKTKQFEIYTNWSALGRATGWSADSIRQLWGRNKSEHEKNGMKYKGFVLSKREKNHAESELVKCMLSKSKLVEFGC